MTSPFKPELADRVIFWIFVAVCALLVSGLFSEANGAELTLGVHTVSAHVPARESQNNANFGAYVIYDGWTVGAYRNTLERESIHAGYSVALTSWADITMGVVSGYQKKSRAMRCPHEDMHDCLWTDGYSSGVLTPMLSPSVHYGPARIWYVPSLGQTSSVFHLGLEHKFE
jgi:hypothetical protein